MKIAIFLLIILSPFFTAAKTYPVDKDTLYQTQVMFEWNETRGTAAYLFEIYNDKNEAVFTKKVHSLAYLVKDILHYGNKYSWIVTPLNNKHRTAGKQTSFFIKSAPITDKSIYLFNIVTEKSGAGIIFLDGCGAAIDYAGNVVWYMNEKEIREKEKGISYRNLQLSPQGTLTVLIQKLFLETGLDGQILWDAPRKGVFSNDSLENYHHDGIRMNSGDYLIASHRFEREECYHNPSLKCKVKYGTLVQYNKDKSLTWAWNEKGNVLPKDIYLKNDERVSDIAGTHLNGFDADQKNNRILMSFRDNNRIIIINKRTGKVTKDFFPEKGISFHGQHGPAFINSNEIIFYNNNLVRDKNEETKRDASVMILNFEKGKTTAKWEYHISSDSFPEGTAGKEGSVQVLRNGNYLVSTGGKNRVFEVNKNKEVVWDCYMASYNQKRKEVFTNYRVRYYSSLYPRYFTVQSKLPSAAGEIKINNDGTDDDEYEVFLKEKKNVLLRTIKINAGKSVTVNMGTTRIGKKLLIKPKGVEGIYREVTF